MKELLLKAMELGCQYQIRYVDYEVGCYTMPVLLTENRINEMLSDSSVCEIFIIITP
jgi:hypothetical protein